MTVSHAPQPAAPYERLILNAHRLTLMMLVVLMVFNVSKVSTYVVVHPERASLAPQLQMGFVLVIVMMTGASFTALYTQKRPTAALGFMTVCALAYFYYQGWLLLTHA